MRRLTLAIALAFAAGGALAHAWLRTPPMRIHTDLAQPLVVVTYWAGFGRLMTLALASALLAGTVAYLALLARISHSRETPARRALVYAIAGSSLALAAALAWPVIFSSDVYAYGTYATMALHGVNPYDHRILPTSDPMFAATIWQWSNPPPACVYGPLFVGIASAAIAPFAHAGVAAQLLALRVVASLALLACAPLFYYALSGFPRPQRLAAAAGIVLHPVAIWSAAEGHNDALMLAIVLAGAILVRHARFGLGAFVAAASALVKAPGVAAAAMLALYAWPNRRRFVASAGGALGGLALSTAAFAPFLLTAHDTSASARHFAPQLSLQWLTTTVAATALPAYAHPLEVGIVLALLAVAAVLLYGVRLVLRGERDGAGYVALALWLAIPNPYPWYALWIAPVALALLDRTIGRVLLAASLAIGVRYLAEATYPNDLATNLFVTLTAFALPLAAFVVGRPRAGAQPAG